MHINEITRDARRGRFTVPTADLSALGSASMGHLADKSALRQYIVRLRGIPDVAW